MGVSYLSSLKDSSSSSKKVKEPIVENKNSFLKELREKVESAETNIPELEISIPNMHETLFDTKLINDGILKLVLKDYNIEGKLTVEKEVNPEYMIVKLHEHECFYGGKVRNKRIRLGASFFLVRILPETLAPDFAKNWKGKCAFLFEATGSKLSGAIEKLEGLIPEKKMDKVHFSPEEKKI
jgi:hypothetical protein